MDESWRMRMGITYGGATTGKRQSTAAEQSRQCLAAGDQPDDVAAALEPEDFDDVFGGPPKSVLARKLSGDFSGSQWFYQEVFRQQETEYPVITGGRRLPEFVIPERMSKSKLKAMSRSKSTSSSVLSFEELRELSPHRTALLRDEDVALSSFTSRLRPISVPSRWCSSSTSMMPRTKQELPAFGDNTHFTTNDHYNDYMIKRLNFGFPQSPSPETINLETKTDVKIDDDEVMNSYVIEINSKTTEVNNSEAIDIDEAIAWAKEKFQGWTLDDGESLREQESNLFVEMQGDYN